MIVEPVAPEAAAAHRAALVALRQDYYRLLDGA